MVALLCLVLAPAALAKGLGPINATNHFPEWVEDNSVPAIRLDLPNPPYRDGVNAPTLIFDPVITGNTLSEATGFGAEAFFYLAESIMDLPNGGKALLVLGIVAAYGAGEPDHALVTPDQFLFARVRVRFDATVAGTYTVTHPWGVETLKLTAADVGTLFSHTFDCGGFGPWSVALPPVLLTSASAGFERILLSHKDWVFLQARDKTFQAGQGDFIIGDGVTPTPVTRTDGGAVVTFKIEGPAGAFGTTNIVESTLFTVSGHIAGAGIPTPVTTNPPPPAVDTITITAKYTTKNQTLEVRATSTQRTAILTAVGFGTLQKGKLTVRTSPAPTSVTVTFQLRRLPHGTGSD